MAQDKLTKIQERLNEEEGFLDVIYLDSLGKATGGTGHLLTEKDLNNYSIDRYKDMNTKYGTRKVAVDKQGNPIKLSKETTNSWFENDIATAMSAASEQAKELGIDSEDFEIALTDVNFQLGTGWKNKFPSAYKALQDGNYEEAVKQINTNNQGGPSAWKTQTENRVKNFSDAIMGLQQQEQPMSQNDVMLIKAKQNASKVAGNSFNILNVMNDLGQVFEPFEGGE